MPVSVGAVTVTVAIAEKPMYVAVMVAVPGPRPNTNPRVPPLVTLAMAVADDVQVAWLLTSWVVLSAKIAVAKSRVCCPTRMLLRNGVTWMSTTVDTGMQVSVVESVTPMYVPVMTVVPAARQV